MGTKVGASSEMQTAANISPAPKAGFVCPDCSRMALLPYCDVNCANASPVISQLTAAQPTKAAIPGPLTIIASSSARRTRGGGLARRYVVTPTSNPAAATHATAS